MPSKGLFPLQKAPTNAEPCRQKGKTSQWKMDNLFGWVTGSGFEVIISAMAIELRDERWDDEMVCIPGSVKPNGGFNHPEIFIQKPCDVISPPKEKKRNLNPSPYVMRWFIGSWSFSASTGDECIVETTYSTLVTSTKRARLLLSDDLHRNTTRNEECQNPWFERCHTTVAGSSERWWTWNYMDIQGTSQWHHPWCRISSINCITWGPVAIFRFHVGTGETKIFVPFLSGDTPVQIFMATCWLGQQMVLITGDSIPVQSMYGLLTYIWLIFMVFM